MAALEALERWCGLFKAPTVKPEDDYPSDLAEALRPFVGDTGREVDFLEGLLDVANERMADAVRRPSEIGRAVQQECRDRDAISYAVFCLKKKIIK